MKYRWSLEPYPGSHKRGSFIVMCTVSRLIIYNHDLSSDNTDHPWRPSDAHSKCKQIFSNAFLLPNLCKFHFHLLQHQHLDLCEFRKFISNTWSHWFKYMHLCRGFRELRKRPVSSLLRADSEHHMSRAKKINSNAYYCWNPKSSAHRNLLKAWSVSQLPSLSMSTMKRAVFMTHSFCWRSAPTQL